MTLKAVEDSTITNRGESLEFENKTLSKTVDLGSLHLEEEYGSLVIPPPPEESFSIHEQDIAIVPPVESVKDRKKMFEKTDSKGYLENFGRKEAGVAAASETLKKDTDTKDNVDVPKLNSKQAVEEKNGDSNVDGASDSSPASVSEKLNALLKSLSSYQNEEDEPQGNFRRTSSLRLGRCSSLDFLNTPKVLDTNGNKNSDLVTGSVRVRPRVRPKLDMDRTFQPGSGHVSVPLKTNSLDRVNNGTHIRSDHNGSENPVSPGFHRANSVDVIPTTKSEKADDDNSMSESFASLKAKLQSYRDSLLNRSIRRKKKLAGERDDTESDSGVEGIDSSVQRKSSLTRSNSFSSLVRRSLGRSSGKEVKDKLEGRSSSETCADKSDGAKDDTKNLGKEKKYWNTLTTPRSTFRPNLGANQTQVSTGLNHTYFTIPQCIIFFIFKFHIVKL